MKESRLHDVVPVGAVGALAVVVAVVVGVVVARPLEVHVVLRPDDHIDGMEVVLRRGVGLHDVAALALDVEVVDLCARTYRGRARLGRGRGGARGRDRNKGKGRARDRELGLGLAPGSP